MPKQRYKITNIGETTCARKVKDGTLHNLVVNSNLSVFLEPGEEMEFCAEGADLAMHHLKRLAENAGAKLKIEQLEYITTEGTEKPWVVILKANAEELAEEQNKRHLRETGLMFYALGRGYLVPFDKPMDISEAAANSLMKAYGHFIEKIMPKADYKKVEPIPEEPVKVKKVEPKKKGK